jgi:hypothetical protein
MQHSAADSCLSARTKAAFQREQNTALESPPQLITDTNGNQTDQPSRLFPSGLPTASPAAQADVVDKGVTSNSHMQQIQTSPHQIIERTASEHLARPERENKRVNKVWDISCLWMEQINTLFCPLRHSHLTAIE